MLFGILVGILMLRNDIYFSSHQCPSSSSLGNAYRLAVRADEPQNHGRMLRLLEARSQRPLCTNFQPENGPRIAVEPDAMVHLILPRSRLGSLVFKVHIPTVPFRLTTTGTSQTECLRA